MPIGLRTACIIVVSLLAATARAAEPLSEEAFTELYVATLTRLHAGVDVQTRAPLDVVIKREKTSFRLFLDNAYLEYRANPDDLDRVVRHHIGSLEAAIAARRAPPSAERIVPVVKGDAFVAGIAEQVREQGRGELAEYYVIEPLAEGLHVLYVFDYEDSVQYVTADDVARLGISRGDLREIGVRNLRALMSDVKREGNDRWRFMVADGNYEASLLLLDGLWNEQSFDLKGEPVVFVLARDTVLIIGADDNEALQAARELAEKAAREWPYFISSYAYVHGKDGWRRYLP